jgi:hypothetical protein
MVKATTVEPLKAHQAHRDPSTKEDKGSIDVDHQASDVDEESFADCLTKHEDDTEFDDLVDKCFIIQEVGKTRKVTYTENGVEVQKDVYNQPADPTRICIT